MSNPESFEPAPDPGMDFGERHLSFSEFEEREFKPQEPDETDEQFAQRQLDADRSRFIAGLVMAEVEGVDGMRKAIENDNTYRISRIQKQELYRAIGTMPREEYEDRVNAVGAAFPNENAWKIATRIADQVRKESHQFVREEAEAEAAEMAETAATESMEGPSVVAEAVVESEPPVEVLSAQEAARRYRGDKQKRRGGFFSKLKSKVREVLTGDSYDYDTSKPWGAPVERPARTSSHYGDRGFYPDPVPAGRRFSGNVSFSEEHEPGYYFGGAAEMPDDPIEPSIAESESRSRRTASPTEIPDISRPSVLRRSSLGSAETGTPPAKGPSVLRHVGGATPLPERGPSVLRHMGDVASSLTPPKKNPSVLRPLRPESPTTSPTEGGEGVSKPEKPVTPPAEDDKGKGPEAGKESAEPTAEGAETVKSKPTVEVDGESVSFGEFASRLIKERARVEGLSLEESVSAGKWNKDTLAHIGEDGAPREWAQLTGWLKKHPEEMPRFIAEYEDLKTKKSPGEDAGVDLGGTHLPFSRFEQASFDTSRHTDVKDKDFETVSEYKERLQARDRRRFIAYFLAQQSGGREAVEALKDAEDFVISEEQEKQAEKAMQEMNDEEYSKIVEQALEAAIPNGGERPFTFSDHNETNASPDDIREYYWNEFARKIKPKPEAAKKGTEEPEEAKKPEEAAPAEAPGDKKAA